MKNLVLFFLLLSQSSNAQIIPFVTEGNTWITMASPEPNFTYFYQWEITGDVILNTVHYKKIYQFGLGINHPGLQGYVRQEGRKVYFKPVFPSESLLCDTSEVLLYNFAPEVGDSLKFWRCDHNGTQFITAPLDTVSDIGQYFGDIRNYIHHGFAFGGVYEEVGYLNGPLTPWSFQYEAIPFVICFNGYTSGPGIIECISSVTPNVGLDKEFWVDNPLQRNTLVVNTSQKIANPGFELLVFDLNGQRIYESGKFIKDTRFEQVLDIPNGIYFLQIKTVHGIGWRKIIVQ
jgi:hypothetical protein